MKQANFTPNQQKKYGHVFGTFQLEINVNILKKFQRAIKKRKELSPDFEQHGYVLTKKDPFLDEIWAPPNPLIDQAQI